MSALPDSEPGPRRWLPAPPLPADAPSHGGLSDLDPWASGARSARVAWLHLIREALDILILALVLFVGIRLVAHNYVVDGGSMLPTFEDGDLLVVNRLAYREFDLSWLPGVDEASRPFGTPQPGDVVVFHLSSERDLLKRVIAIEGQTVMVTGGRVFVDGVALDEPYLAEPPVQESPPITVAPGRVFVMGDNRNNSDDSRRFGPIEVDSIVGRADLRYWPWDRIALFPD
jgi:signal peptidase I